MNDRLNTLLAKIQEALTSNSEQSSYECRAVLRLALAELPLIHAAYEREIAELRGIISNHEKGE